MRVSCVNYSFFLSNIGFGRRTFCIRVVMKLEVQSNTHQYQIYKSMHQIKDSNPKMPNVTVTTETNKPVAVVVCAIRTPLLTAKTNTTPSKFQIPFLNKPLSLSLSLKKTPCLLSFSSSLSPSLFPSSN